jgi:hypothetical protein
LLGRGEASRIRTGDLLEALAALLAVYVSYARASVGLEITPRNWLG